MKFELILYYYLTIFIFLLFSYSTATETHSGINPFTLGSLSKKWFVSTRIFGTISGWISNLTKWKRTTGHSIMVTHFRWTALSSNLQQLRFSISPKWHFINNFHSQYATIQHHWKGRWSQMQQVRSEIEFRD